MSKNKTFIIAEIGINHNGDLNLAKKMIDEAANCGVDAIKFQSFSADELFSKKLNPDFFKFAADLSINRNQHQQLKKYSQKINRFTYNTSRFPLSHSTKYY